MTIFIFMLILFIVLKTISSAIVVKHNEAIVVERLGQYHKTLECGLHFIFDPIDRIRPFVKQTKVRTIDGKFITTQTYSKTIDMRETEYKFTIENLIDKNNTKVDINTVLNFQIVNPIKAIYSTENFPNAIMGTIQRNLKQFLQEHSTEELFRPNILADYTLNNNITNEANEYGIEIKNIEILDVINKN